MADDAEKEDKPADDDVEVTLEDGDEGEAGGKKKLNKKKLIILVAVAVLVLGGAGGGAAFFLLGSDGPEEVELLPTEYVTLEPMVVDLAGKSRRVDYVKLQISIGVSGTYKSALEEKTPFILDAMKSHLRGKTRKDIQGRQGTEELRGDLLRIIGNIMKPAQIEAVLFKDILVQ